MKEANLKNRSVFPESGEISKAEMKRMQSQNIVSNISLEEWDCPQPGVKYLPKSVKKNIKENRKAAISAIRNQSREVATTP